MEIKTSPKLSASATLIKTGQRLRWLAAALAQFGSKESDRKGRFAESVGCSLCALSLSEYSGAALNAARRLASPATATFPAISGTR